MNLFLLTASVADTSSAIEGASAGGGILALLTSGVLPMILLFVAFYFFLIRPQRKKEKEVQKMRSNIEIGDEIVTIGGIMGIVTNIKEDVLVIETGADRSKVRIAKWAVQENLTVHDAPAE